MTREEVVACLVCFITLPCLLQFVYVTKLQYTPHSFVNRYSINRRSWFNAENGRRINATSSGRRNRPENNADARRCNGDVMPGAYLENNEVYAMPSAVILWRRGGLSFKHRSLHSERLVTVRPCVETRSLYSPTARPRKFRPCAVSDAALAITMYPYEHVRMTSY